MRMPLFLAAVAIATAGCKSPAEPAGAEPSREAVAPASARPEGAASPAEPNAAATTPAPVSSEGEAVLHIDGMVCEGCANAAKSCLEGIDGVAHVDVSFQEGTARVRFDSGRTSAQALATAATCGFACSGAGCTQRCLAGAKCTLACGGGGCEQVCRDKACTKKTCEGSGCR